MTQPADPFATRPAMRTLEDLQAPVAARLDRAVEEMKRVGTGELHGAGREVGEHLLAARGKLLRPTLLLLSNEAGGEPDPRAETVAAVVELLHLATLVHDDAVDHSALRRGAPTVNAVWNHQMAVIVGDYLYSRCMVELARMGELDSIRVLASAANQMTVGEIRQLATDVLDWGEDAYYHLIQSKTASLFAAACEIGATVSGTPHLAPALGRFGFELGMAFQIADDLLDYTAESSETGKPARHDLREGKLTLPLLSIRDTLSAAERDELNQFFRADGADEQVLERIAGWVRDRGGLENAKRAAQEFAERANTALDGLPSAPAVDALRDSVVYAVERQR